MIKQGSRTLAIGPFQPGDWVEIKDSKWPGNKPTRGYIGAFYGNDMAGVEVNHSGEMFDPYSIRREFRVAVSRLIPVTCPGGHRHVGECADLWKKRRDS